MKRRVFIAGAAAAGLARPAIAQPTKTLIFVPQANLTSLDPVWTTATVTRNFSLMVYETLYGRDQDFVPRPQMVEGHVIDDDGKRWTMTLRPGLLFKCTGFKRIHHRAHTRTVAKWCLGSPITESLGKSLQFRIADGRGKRTLRRRALR